MRIQNHLKKEHKHILSLFSKYARAWKKSIDAKREIFEEIRGEIQIHAQVERDVLYAALEQSGEAELLERALDEHREIDRRIDELTRLAPGDDFENRIKVLRENVEVHAEFEERVLLEALENHYGDGELESMGREIEERREVAKTARGHAS